MSFKRWGLSACITVVASLSTSGSSLSSVYRERPLPTVDVGVMGTLPAVISKRSVVFGSALQNAPEEATVITLKPDPIRTDSNDLSKGQDGLASLPESGSGVLLGFALLAAIPFAHRHRFLFGKD
jgi:hypothetical protein